MSDGKCPKCEKMISVELRRGPIGNPGTRLVLENGFIAICPHCKTILGVLSDSDNIAEKIALQAPPASKRTSPNRAKQK